MTVTERIKAACADPAFQRKLADLLLALCAIDTTPDPDVSLMRRRESDVFALLRAYLAGGMWRLEERNVPADIERHPAFSKLHFTRTPDRPEGLSANETYGGRCNLLALAEGEPSPVGHGTAVNAHVDVIAPFIPPRRSGNAIFGRGTADDKGNAVAICAALKLIEQLCADGTIALKNAVTAMFVIEEETGGNGSLALALDRDVKQRYDALLVLECADMNVYPANRGAVWFRCEVTQRMPGSGNGVSLPEAVAFAVLEMQREGAAIKAESDHPLFPHRPVQTCNGILGPFGEHPSRINGRVAFTLRGLTPEGEASVREALCRGRARYVDAYGDKAQVLDPATGLPKVDHHLDVAQGNNGGLSITVHGSTGHMGAILENDDAIVKWAYLVRELVDLRREEGISFDIELEGADSSRQLVLEGGQGFLPTHDMPSVQNRMAAAFARGVKQYLRECGVPGAPVSCATTYEKLHNNAYDGDPNSPTLRNARAAAVEAGLIAPDAPVRGWDVSCDARLFAGEYPDMPVLTGGAGRLSVAHSDRECLDLPDLWKTICFLTLFLLKETGSV